ncbi:MAG TPA: YetF domain-containing protein [Pseudonocardia sp.]|jgi:uncharacterized membrane protein YcaP (DUF421 family)|nr:YetF domain-containing protein [Pseudonocardia sp.]
MWAELGITPLRALDVVISTVVIYLVFIVLVRLAGQRTLAAMSNYDIVCAIAVGAVLGRTALLATPTLGTGVVGLVTLFVMQRLLGVAHRYPLYRALFDRTPVLLMVGGELRVAEMRRARVTEDELNQRLRLAGITRLEQVGCVVFERNGQISVLRRDPGLEPRLLDDVPGAAGLGKSSWS